MAGRPGGLSLPPLGHLIPQGLPSGWGQWPRAGRWLVEGEGHRDMFPGRSCAPGLGRPSAPGALPALTASPSAHQGSGGKLRRRVVEGPTQVHPWGQCCRWGLETRLLGYPRAWHPPGPAPYLPLPRDKPSHPSCLSPSRDKHLPGHPPQSKRSPRVEHSGMLGPRATPTSSLLLSCGQGQQPAGTH